ncbi:MAG: four helix bundle protein [Acidobacteriota bacterium]
MSSKIERFEDLVAWQKARELTRAICAISRQSDFAKDFGLCDQIRRTAVSIMSNIAEGFERANPREFHQFLSIAKSSCAEVRSQLYVAFDAGYLSNDLFSDLMISAEEAGRIIGGLRVSVEKKRDVK